jgi:hypothetical protein
MQHPRFYLPLRELSLKPLDIPVKDNPGQGGVRVRERTALRKLPTLDIKVNRFMVKIPIDRMRLSGDPGFDHDDGAAGLHTSGTFSQKPGRVRKMVKHIQRDNRPQAALFHGQLTPVERYSHLPGVQQFRRHQSRDEILQETGTSPSSSTGPATSSGRASAICRYHRQYGLYRNGFDRIMSAR